VIRELEGKSVVSASVELASLAVLGLFDEVALLVDERGNSRIIISPIG